MPSFVADRRKGLLWALSSAVGGAFMVIPWKLANEMGDPATNTLLLLGFAAIGNTLLALGQHVRQRVGQGGVRFRIKRMDLYVAAALAVATLLGNLFSAWAIQDLTPALLNVLLRSDVLFVALLGAIALRERVDLGFWIGAAIAAVGLVVLQGPTESTGLREFLSSGTGLAVIAAFCFSALAVLTRRFIHEIDPVGVNTLRLWLSVAFWFPFNVVPDWNALPQQQVLYCLIAAIAGPFLGRLALMISARHVEARVTALATLMTPVLTLVAAFVLLSDWPASYELLGGAIMMGGIAIPILGLGRSSRE